MSSPTNKKSTSLDLLDLLIENGNDKGNNGGDSVNLDVSGNDKEKDNFNSSNKYTNEELDKMANLTDNDSISTLISMGFDKDLIDTIYKNMQPVDLQEALDLLNTNADGKFTHSYIANAQYLCTICGKGRTAHENQSTYLSTLNKNYVRPSQTFHRTSMGTGNKIQELKDKDESENKNNNNNKEFETSDIDILDGDNDNDNSDRFNFWLNYYKEGVGRNSIVNKKKNNNGLSNVNYTMDKECGICFELIKSYNTQKTKLPCDHFFCESCWFDYLQEKITNANVLKISCMQNKCIKTLSENFVKQIIGKDKDLLNKYEKFLLKKKILDGKKNVKGCPYPDCDGFAHRKTKNKYVTCNFGHKFCFNCANKPHGYKKCSDMIDQDFEKWKKGKIVKQCPHCKFWTEKNEGCNHMTCVECKYQWCWLCLGKYNSNHYYYGCCKGLQFYKETDPEKIKKRMEENMAGRGEVGDIANGRDHILLELLYKLGYFSLYLFMLPYIYFFVVFDHIGDSDINDNCLTCLFYYTMYVPYFIYMEIKIVLFMSIIGMPGLFIEKYRCWLVDTLFGHTIDRL